MHENTEAWREKSIIVASERRCFTPVVYHAVFSRSQSSVNLLLSDLIVLFLSLQITERKRPV
jgi:hypothetical protein